MGGLAPARARQDANDALAAERLARHLARTALTVIASSAPEHDALPVRMAVRLVAGLSDSKEEK